MSTVKNTYIVTGANGFLGNNIIRKLITKSENEIRALVLPNDKIKSLEGLNCKIFYGDVTKKETLNDIFDVDIDTHLYAHVHQRRHAQGRWRASPPDHAGGGFRIQSVSAAQGSGFRVAVLGQRVEGFVQQQMADARQPRQADARGRVFQGAGGQRQAGLHLPEGGRAADVQMQGGGPAGNVEFVQPVYENGRGLGHGRALGRYIH